MHSKNHSYAISSRFSPRSAAFAHNGGYVSDQSSYSYNQSDAPLRFIVIRHAERIDITYGAGWTRYAFNSAGQYYPFADNMPPSLPYRTNWQDYDVDTPLTANGLKQAWNVGNVLAKYNLPVTACYTSPAFRSIQTADQILDGMGRRGETILHRTELDRSRSLQELFR